MVGHHLHFLKSCNIAENPTHYTHTQASDAGLWDKAVCAAQQVQ